MLDQFSETVGHTTTPPSLAHFDLIVVGAGIAGLNALYAASHYLSKTAKVLLIDEKPAAGGMWTVAYNYVRLHQPHPMFTVGDMKWDWNKPPHYLAKRDEVQDHLAGTLARMHKLFHLSECFGHSVSEAKEVATPTGHQAQVTLHPVGASDTTTTVTADQIIHAAGFNYQSPTPIPVSSQNVLTIIPNDLTATLAANPNADVYVVGGGKTGMDTILAVLEEDSRRSVTLLNGRGTNFFNRTEYLPQGFDKWTKGAPLSRVFYDIAMRYDGTNEDQVSLYFRDTYATDPKTPNEQFLYGLQSKEELTRIEKGLAETRGDYLTDVVDGARGPVMMLRSGAEVPVKPGSIFVNCTGNIFRTPEPVPLQPCLSPHGTILSVSPRDAMHFLTSVSGFFLPHLHYRGKLRTSGMYMLDNDLLFRKNRNAWIAATSTQAYLNQTLCVKHLPLMLLDKCALDFDRWYPLPRRMLALMKMKAGTARDVPACQKTLDTVARRFGVHCAPIQ